MDSTIIHNFNSIHQLEAITCSKDKFIVLKIDDEYLDYEDLQYIQTWFKDRGIDCLVLRDFTDTAVLEFEDLAEVEMMLLSQYHNRKKRTKNGC